MNATVLLTMILIAGMSVPSFAQHQADREQARQALEQMMLRPHVALDVLLEAGAKLADREQFELARAAFARGVRDYPQSFEARYDLALADFALRNFSEAQATLDGAGALSIKQQLSREYLRGKIYDVLGQTDLAERSLLAAFQGAPQQENYTLDLGVFYLRRQSYTKALRILQGAAKYHANSIYFELELGLAQVLGGEPCQTIATCRRILAQEPNFGPARLLLVAAYYLAGENQNCATEAEAALRLPGGLPHLHYLHAASLLKLNSKEYAVMLHDLDEAKRGMPNCAFCYFAQSKVHQEMGDEGAAIADLQELVTRVDTEFAQGWYRLANLYQRSGRQADAAKALTRFRSIQTTQTDLETEYLRQMFLSALGAAHTGQ